MRRRTIDGGKRKISVGMRSTRDHDMLACFVLDPRPGLNLAAPMRSLSNAFPFDIIDHACGRMSSRTIIEMEQRSNVEERNTTGADGRGGYGF